MPKITLTGVSPTADGDYDLNFDEGFNGHELHLIKQHAGVRVGEIGDAMGAGDYDLIVALAKIALDRAGRSDVTLDMLMDAKAGSLEFGSTEAETAEAEEEAALPPANAPTGRDDQTSDSDTSGISSSNGSDSLPENALPDIGVPASPTGSAYDQAT